MRSLSAAMAQRRSELLKLQTLEKIAGYEKELEAQLRIAEGVAD